VIVEVNSINKGHKQAWRDAIKEVLDHFRLADVPQTYSVAIDGNVDKRLALSYPDAKFVVRADAFIPAVMAAGILAKVTRTRIMRELGKQYPKYGFEKHAGYGTRQHKEACIQWGTTPQHRNVRPLHQSRLKRT